MSQLLLYLCLAIVAAVALLGWLRGLAPMEILLSAVSLAVAAVPELALTAGKGEVVRFYLTNTANTRVFNVGLPGARMKRVGGDSGHYEREEFVDGVILAPSERVVVDVLFDRAEQLRLEHRTPHRAYPLATITVMDEHAEPSLAAQFANLRTNVLCITAVN